MQESIAKWVVGKKRGVAEQRVYAALCDLGLSSCNQISTHLMTKGILMPPNNVNRRLRGLEKQGLVVIAAKTPLQLWITTNRMRISE